jgi:tetratricopeptide (TPR) repeat protein
VCDIPKNAGAYAFYLRANQLANEASRWSDARDLYRASIDADPDYAPAWARLARCERLIGKFSASAEEARSCLSRAEDAFQRALALNPDLPIGHSFYAQLLIDLGHADDAMQRLLERARRRPADAELYAGLVHALRYCGLLDASVAAHERAHSLDPTVPTSISRRSAPCSKASVRKASPPPNPQRHAFTTPKPFFTWRERSCALERTIAPLSSFAASSTKDSGVTRRSCAIRGSIQFETARMFASSSKRRANM